MLKVDRLSVVVEGRQILKDVSLQLKPGELVAVMGPNGSGKTSLGMSLIGVDKYVVKQGKIELDGKNLLRLKVDERIKQGLWLSWQNPMPIRGVSVEQLLRAMVINCRNVICERTGQTERCVRLSEFRQLIEKEARGLKIDKNRLRREINVGFSGGEKKRLEMLQLLLLRPKYAVLDEIDSGLDGDGLKLIGKKIKELKKNKTGILLITHYQRILELVKPDRVVVMKQGRLVRQKGKGGYEGIE